MKAHNRFRSFSISLIAFDRHPVEEVDLPSLLSSCGALFSSMSATRQVSTPSELEMIRPWFAPSILMGKFASSVIMSDTDDLKLVKAFRIVSDVVDQMQSFLMAQKSPEVDLGYLLIHQDI